MRGQVTHRPRASPSGQPEPRSAEGIVRKGRSVEMTPEVSSAGGRCRAIVKITQTDRTKAAEAILLPDPSHPV